jgi:3-hydroxyisobutyrate dehydrogenase-like beta-hydroxyacid dehydrogenase
MRITVFGLGEAGSRFAADLARAGADVRGFDPADVATPGGVERFDDPRTAVDGAELVMALTAAADAPRALAQALTSIARGVVYADLATGSASLKQSLAVSAAGQGVLFADVAMMAMVPPHGMHTPSLVSGDGAAGYRSMMRTFGVEVESISELAGDAATRKLLRSVFMKGLAAVVIEAVSAAAAAGQEEWLWSNLVDEVTAAGEPWLTRLVQGTGPHSLRRWHEMEASAQLLTELGIDPIMTRSTVQSLQRIVRDGLPELGTLPGE